MQLADHFDVLLKDTVNLSQPKLDLLETRVESIYEALNADDQIGALIIGKSPQGSWPSARSSTRSETTSSTPTSCST